MEIIEKPTEILQQELVYISGKISGLDLKDAFDSFEEAEAELKNKGYNPINPMKIIHNHDLSWSSYMKADLVALLSCKYIYMINGWESSKGAQIELELATSLSIERIY